MVLFLLVVIAIMAIVANITGIYFLLKRRREGSRIILSNQAKIIIGISFCNTLLAGLDLCEIISRLVNPEETDKEVDIYALLIFFSLYVTWYALLYLLMLDRLIGLCFPFWYRLHVTPRWIDIGIGFCWFTTFIIVPALWLSRSREMFNNLRKFGWLVLDLGFVVLFIVLYTSVFRIKHKSSKQIGRSIRQVHNKHFIVIVARMLFKFLILQTVPTIIVFIMFYTCSKEVIISSELYFRILWNLNIFSDPLIYIFSYPDVSRRLTFALNKFCCRNEEDASVKNRCKTVYTINSVDTKV